jgi:hypothetical protein
MKTHEKSIAALALVVILSIIIMAIMTYNHDKQIKEIKYTLTLPPDDPLEHIKFNCVEYEKKPTVIFQVQCKKMEGYEIIHLLSIEPLKCPQNSELINSTAEITVIDGKCLNYKVSDK